MVRGGKGIQPEIPLQGWLVCSGEMVTPETTSSDRSLFCGPTGCQLQREQGRAVGRGSLEAVPPQPLQPPECHHQWQSLHPVLGQEDPDQAGEPHTAGFDREDIWCPCHRGRWGLKLQRGQCHVRGVLLCWW